MSEPILWTLMDVRKCNRPLSPIKAFATEQAALTAARHATNQFRKVIAVPLFLCGEAPDA